MIGIKIYNKGEFYGYNTSEYFFDISKDIGKVKLYEERHIDRVIKIANKLVSNGHTSFECEYQDGHVYFTYKIAYFDVSEVKECSDDFRKEILLEMDYSWYYMQYLNPEKKARLKQLVQMAINYNSKVDLDNLYEDLKEVYRSLEIQDVYKLYTECLESEK